VESLGTVIPANAQLAKVVGVLIAVTLRSKPERSKMTCAAAGIVRFPPVTVSLVGPMMVEPKQIVVPVPVAAANELCRSTKVVGVLSQLVADADEIFAKVLPKTSPLRIAADAKTLLTCDRDGRINYLTLGMPKTFSE
jgi:hypothetical protein